MRALAPIAAMALLACGSPSSEPTLPSPPAASAPDAATTPPETAPRPIAFTAFDGRLRARVIAMAQPTIAPSKSAEGTEQAELSIDVGSEKPIACTLRPTRIKAWDLVTGTLKLLEPYATTIARAESSTAQGRQVVTLAVAYADKESGAPLGHLDLVAAVGASGSLFCRQAQREASPHFGRAISELLATATDFATEPAAHVELWEQEGGGAPTYARELFEAGDGTTQERLVALEARLDGATLKLREATHNVFFDRRGLVDTAVITDQVRGTGDVKITVARESERDPTRYALTFGVNDARRELHVTVRDLTTVFARRERLRSLEETVGRKLSWTELGGMPVGQTNDVVRERTATRVPGALVLESKDCVERCHLAASGLCDRLETCSGAARVVLRRSFVASTPARAAPPR